MVITFLLTTIPTVLYVALLWWLDRYEKEPLPLLVAVFVWGAVPAVALALLAERDLYTLNAGVDFEPSVWVAPLVEEPLKALALIGIFVFFRYEFDGILDGIIYGALIGFGFAMTENALYFYQQKSDLTPLVWLRVVLFGFNHAFYTSIVGVTLGMMRYRLQAWTGWLALPGALVIAMFFHALHNQTSGAAFPGVLVAWLINSGGVLVVVLVALIAWRHEQYWIRTQLLHEVKLGLISPHMYQIAGSSQLRVRSQWRALTRHGWAEYRRIRELHHLLTELAFLKHQLHIGDSHCRPSDLAPLKDRIHDLLEPHERSPEEAPAVS